MDVYKNRKILIIINQWPSIHHPYITHLIPELSNYYSSIEIFLFRCGNIEKGKELIGSKSIDKVLNKIKLRWQYTRNPLKYIHPLKNILLNWNKSYYIYKVLIQEGYCFRRAIGQLLYHHSLIGQEYDLVYVNALQTTKHICLKAFFENTTIIASSRGQDFDFEPDVYIETLPQINYLHTLGAYLANKAIELGYDKNKITLIPPAFLPYRQSNDAGSNLNKENEFVITTAARLEWTKGFHYMLRTIATVSRNNPGLTITYNIVGDGRENEFLRVETERLGLHEVVHFHGWCTQDKVNKIVSQSDIYLLLSIVEGFNNSVLQAQYLGIPCIVSNTGGLPENVLNGITGYVVERYETIRTAEIITELIKNRTILNKLGKQAKSRALDNFSLNHQVDKFTNFFNYALGNY